MSAMTSYYEDLERAKALGLEYATNGIAAGEYLPQESPLSGEWAGAVTVADIARVLGVSDPSTLEDFELTDIADFWEDGYNSAPWPGLMRRLVMAGKQGPAFGDRASWTLVTVSDEEGSVFDSRIANWPATDRADALRAAFAPLIEGAKL